MLRSPSSRTAKTPRNLYVVLLYASQTTMHVFDHELAQFLQQTLYKYSVVRGQFSTELSPHVSFPWKLSTPPTAVNDQPSAQFIPTMISTLQSYTSPSLPLLSNSQQQACKVKMADSCRHLYKLITQRANRLYAGRGARRGPALVRSGGEATTTTTPQPNSTVCPTSRARHTVRFTSHTATRSISSQDVRLRWRREEIRVRR
jgi:hypothetical protein